MKANKPPVVLDPTNVFEKRDEHISIHTNIICFKAYDRQNGLEVSWYEVSIEQLSEEQKDLLYARAQTVKGFKFNTMLSIITFWFNADRTIFYLISESISCMSILDQMKMGTQPLRLKANIKWGVAVLQTLNYLHNQPIPFPHSRIDLNSIFVKPSSGIKIMYPLINPYKLKTENNNLRIRYNTSPEALFNKVGPESDIWCFGIALLYSITQNQPYSECNSPYSLYQKLKNYQPPNCISLVKDPLAKDLIMKCLQPPSLRPTAAVLLNHEFFMQNTSENETPQVPCGNGIEFLFVKKNASTVSPVSSGVKNATGSLETGLALTRYDNDRNTVSTPYLLIK